MRVGIVFHKDPFAPPAGIDLVRLHAIAAGLIRRGIRAEVLWPGDREGYLDGLVPVRRLSALEERGRYAAVKTCYHDSIELIGRYEGPVVSRIVRVVDERFPERDEHFRGRLLQCQEVIRQRAAVVILNNEENRQRWRSRYGERPPAFLVPTGCPGTIPQIDANPYPLDAKVILFLGSVAAPRMVHLLNAAARRLREEAGIHLVGLNKACLYGGDGECVLDPSVTDHGEIPENRIWNYIGHASIGLALATGPHPFDNDVSKILSYLRGGLPVLSEEPIVNNDLIRQTRFGETFRHGDIDDLVEKALRLLKSPPAGDARSVMDFMAAEHSWERRVDLLVELFGKIQSGTFASGK